MTQSLSTVVKTFLEITKIDSPTGSEAKMVQYVEKYLLDLGLKPYIDTEGNIGVFIPGDSSLDHLFFNAHLDTVEPGRGIKPVVDDEFIRSDGTTILGVDNKGAVASILDAVKKLLSLKTKHRPLDVFFTLAEEGNSHGSIGFDYSRLTAKNGYAFDVSGEQFGTTIISAPFYNRLTIELTGKSGHAKAPERAINVLPTFVKAMSLLPLGRVSPDSLVNIGLVKSGSAVNAIPGIMEIVGEVRSSVESELEKITDDYRKAFTDAGKEFGVTVDFVVARENPGYKINRDNQFLQDTLEKLHQFGLDPEIKDSFGCADANFFAAHGLTTIDIADGSTGAHTTKETISIANLERLSDLVYFLATN